MDDEAPRTDERFAAIVDRHVADPRVTTGTGFGANPGLRVDGRIFAMLVRGLLVVKLPERRVDELTTEGVAVRFDAGKGRPMREWAAVSASAAASWDALVSEAREYAGGDSSARYER
ncbi:MAG: hypothetical protein ACJ77N_00750 [Chloroflexota bacterium]